MQSTDFTSAPPHAEVRQISALWGSWATKGQNLRIAKVAHGQLSPIARILPSAPPRQPLQPNDLGQFFILPVLR
jgi:hypothetical protein